MQKLLNKEHKKQKQNLKMPFVTNKLCLVGPIVEIINLIIIIIIKESFKSLKSKREDMNESKSPMSQRNGCAYF